MVSKKASEDNQIKNYQYKLIDMDSQLFSLWSTDLMGRFAKAISKRVQHYWLVDESQNGKSQVEEKKHIEELKEKNENLTKEEKKILKNYDPYNTFEKQINSNARDYTTEFSRLEMINGDRLVDPNKSLSKDEKEKVDEKIENVKKDEVSNLIDMKDMTKNIKNCVFSENGPVKGQYSRNYEQGGKDSESYNTIGHYIAYDPSGNKVEFKHFGDCDCGYAAVEVVQALHHGNDISKIDIKSAVQEERIKYAENIQNNKAGNIRKAQPYKWILETYPNEYNAFAMRGAGNYFDNHIMDRPLNINEQGSVANKNNRKNVEEIRDKLSKPKLSSQEKEKLMMEFIMMPEGMVPEKDRKNCEIVKDGKVVAYKPYICQGGVLTLPLGCALYIADGITPHKKNIENMIDTLPNHQEYKDKKGKIDYDGFIKHIKDNGIPKKHCFKVALTIVKSHEQELRKTVGEDCYDKVLPNIQIALVSAGYKSGTALNDNKYQNELVTNFKNYAKNQTIENHDKLVLSFYELHPKDKPRNILQSMLAGDSSHHQAIEYKISSAALEQRGYKFDPNTQSKLITLRTIIDLFSNESGLIDKMNHAKITNNTNALNKALDFELKKHKILLPQKDGEKAGKANQNVNDKKTINMSSFTKQSKSFESQIKPKMSWLSKNSRLFFSEN